MTRKRSLSMFFILSLIISILSIVNFPRKIVKAATAPRVTYQSHVQNIGWQPWVSD
jgi:uncharacterized protein YjdB